MAIMENADVIKLLNQCAIALNGTLEWVPANAPEAADAHRALEGVRAALPVLRGNKTISEPQEASVNEFLDCPWLTP